MTTQATLTFENLAVLRRKTEAISDFLQTRLLQHIETLGSLFAPEHVLGKPSSQRELTQSSKSLAELREVYRQFIGKPFDLSRDFESEMVTQIGNRLEVVRADYLHKAVSAQGRAKLVTISSPVRWLLTYRSAYNPSQARQVMVGKEERRMEHLQQFVLNAVVLRTVINRNEGLKDLFSDLRFEIEIKPVQDLGSLPLVSIVAPLPSFRPADDLILASTDFSGVPAFIELIDVDAIHALQDPLKVQIEAIMAEA